MMGCAHRELARLELIRRLHADLFDVLSGEAVSVAVLVRERTRRIVERFDIHIRHICGVVSAHQATVFIVADVRKRKTKARVTGEVPTLVAMDVTFINLSGTEEGQVRIDEQHRVAGRALGWTNYP